MKTLRLYQADALQTLWDAYRAEKRRALMVLATGLGKTVIASHFCAGWRVDHSGRVLFLAHSQEILLLLRKELQATCPEVETGILTSDYVENVDAQFLFATLQTMERRQRTRKVEKADFELVIVDEAHHGQAATYKKVITFFTPLFLMGMTATPDRMDRNDIREIFGPEVYEYPLARALADGWLARVVYRLVTDNFDVRRLMDYIHTLGESRRVFNRNQIDASIFLNERVEEVARRIREAQTGGKRTIVFCRSIEHIARLHPFLPDAAPYHSRIDPRVLERRARMFQSGELQTMLVVDKFNEGVDVPDAELLVFLRSTSSRTIWLQQLGRGLRKTEKKDTVEVLDFVGNCSRVEMALGLAEEVTGQNTYGGGSDPITVEGLGFDFTFSEELREVVALLQRLDVEPYTYEEAQAIARENGWKKTEDYRDGYHLDPRFPRNPVRTYGAAWVSGGKWPGFLGTERKVPRPPGECYATHEEASAAAAGKFKGRRDYRLRYEEVDPKLPSDPPTSYKDVWQSRGRWPGFLGTKRQVRKSSEVYETVDLASAATHRLGIRTRTNYQQKGQYRKDPKLPFDPEATYGEEAFNRIGGWDGYLDRTKGRSDIYRTWEEASVVAMGHGFTTQDEYLEGRKRLRLFRLPANPQRRYADIWEERRGWPGFLGTTYGLGSKLPN